MPSAIEIATRNAEESRDTAQLRMRSSFPNVAVIFDDYLAVFGAGVAKVRYAKEGEHVIGRPGPEGVKWSGPGLVPITRKAKIAAGVQTKKKPGKR